MMMQKLNPKQPKLTPKLKKYSAAPILVFEDQTHQIDVFDFKKLRVNAHKSIWDVFVVKFQRINGQNGRLVKEG